MKSKMDYLIEDINKIFLDHKEEVKALSVHSHVGEMNARYIAGWMPIEVPVIKKAVTNSYHGVSLPWWGCDRATRAIPSCIYDKVMDAYHSLFGAKARHCGICTDRGSERYFDVTLLKPVSIKGKSFSILFPENTNHRVCLKCLDKLYDTAEGEHKFNWVEVEFES